MNDAAQRISRYLLSQLIVNISCGLPIGIGLSVLGIPNAALWGIMVVLLRFIPYLGIVIAAAFPLALAIAVAPDWTLFVWTALLFIGIELVVSNIVEPLVYRGTTGLSSVALIAAATFWTWLWGPIGLLLSTPMTVCLVVLGRHVPRLRFLDILLGNEPVLTPTETFYQRLLANDPEEATEQAEEFAKDRSLGGFYYEVRRIAIAWCCPLNAAPHSKIRSKRCSKTSRTMRMPVPPWSARPFRNSSGVVGSFALPGAMSSTKLRQCC
jgi:hypothetical protein